MKEKKPVGPHKLLKICRRLFFSGALTMLQLLGFVKSMPGKIYARL